MQRRLDNRLGIAFSMDTLGWVAVRQAQHTRAAMLFGAADTVWRAIGSGPDNYATFGVPQREHVQRARTALGGEDYDAAFRRGAGLPTQASLDLALGEDGSGASPAGRRGHSADLQLTRRESEIAELVADGLTNKEIAARLVIAQRTAEGHVERLLRKLGFTSRAQIAGWLAEHRAAD